MRRFFVRAAVVASMSTSFAAVAHADEFEPRKFRGSYSQVLNDTVSMVSDSQAQQLAQAKGLNIVNVTWEDTGRYKGSAVGPNISDMSIQVQEKLPNGSSQLYLMPVIRSPNFGDTTADIPLERFQLLVGNESGDGLRKVNLRDFLGNIREYLHDPGSWKGEKQSLLAKRDTHALVSAQAAFLPIPKAGEAKFNPVLFNYQSMKDDPAVLTILVTREGTSVTIIDNVRDGFDSGGVWGQRLFFNQDGQRASLTGKRLSDVTIGTTPEKPGTPVADANGQAGMNMVMLIQVPLKQKHPMRFDEMEDGYALAEAAPAMERSRGRDSDVENAAIGHGVLEGKFTEIDGLDIERDDRFPVRVTVQFYKATSNGVVNAKDLDDIKSQIDKVYADASYVGSLVTGGDTGRPTEYDGDKTEPWDWWQVFWKRNEQNSGMTREQIIWRRNTVYKPLWVAAPWLEPMLIDDSRE